MRVHKLSELAANKDMPRKMRKAVEFLASPGTAGLPDGEYAVDGADVFARVQTYVTREQDRILFEAHKKYIDIQYIVSGCEKINCTDIENINIVKPYEEKFDICFGTADAALCFPLEVSAGELVVLFPENAHAPKLPAGKPEQVKKIVVKVSV